MRLTSDFFVSALVRRAHGAGAYAVVRRRGAAEAGAVFVVVDRLDGTFDLYGPAPQALMSADAPADRLFEPLITGGGAKAVEARIGSERRMDPDLWVVEVEDRGGRAFVETVPEERAKDPDWPRGW